MMNYLRYLTAQQEEMLEALRMVVTYESPSGEKALLDKLAGYLATQFSGLGADVELFKETEAGNHLRASWGEGPGQVLVLGHMDTVWPQGEIGRRPFRIEGGKAFGPGVYDMKGGLVQSLFALKAIVASGEKPPRKIVFLFTSDEETGSKTSRSLIEAEARKSAFVLVTEPAAGAHGAVKVSRSGWGMYDVKVTGRATHAGIDHINGINAIEEMARQILKLQAMTDYSVGTTVSVGKIRGGASYNVVPDLATAKVDLRARTEKELAAAQARILGLTPFLKGAGVTVTGGINRQPMEATPANAQLYQKALPFARELGFELLGTHVGSISDGNLTSALGIATLDGLGAVGDGAHALHEHIFLEALAPRAALLAKLMAE
jgi:glutamate carboxypeptidase